MKMSDCMREVKAGQIYRHFKGTEYLVICIAKDFETLESLVVYRNLYKPDTFWVRPLKMFLSEVDHEKYPEETQKYRFELVVD